VWFFCRFSILKITAKIIQLGKFFFSGGSPPKKTGPGPGKKGRRGAKKLIFGVIFRFAKNNAENQLFCSIYSLCTKKTGICQLRPKMAKSVILTFCKNNSWNFEKPAIFFMFLSLYFFSCNFQDRKKRVYELFSILKITAKKILTQKHKKNTGFEKFLKGVAQKKSFVVPKLAR